MKLIIQYPQDEIEQILDGLNEEDFIIDQATYCYFRDKVFIKGIENFINEIAPGQFKSLGGFEGAEKVERWYDNTDLIAKYYPKYDKVRDRFYLHKGHIYSYKLLGFSNVTNEIQLMRLNMKDAIDLLNHSPKKIFQTLMRKIHL